MNNTSKYADQEFNWDDKPCLLSFNQAKNITPQTPQTAEEAKARLQAHRREMLLWDAYGPGKKFGLGTIDAKGAGYLAMFLSQKIETKLTQKMTTEEYAEFKNIIVAAQRRASKRALHPMLVAAWSCSLRESRFVPETSDIGTKFEKFLSFLLTVNLKEQLTANEKNTLILSLKDALLHHKWLEDKINDLIDRITEE